MAYRHCEQPGEIEIALIATRGGRRWQLPKGSREPHETSIETAIREVTEEVGLYTEHEGFLRTIDYWYWDTYRKEIPELVHKSVDFYLLRVVGGELSDACYEVDGVGWFTFDQAADLLTFSGEQEVAALARAQLDDAKLTAFDLTQRRKAAEKEKICPVVIPTNGVRRNLSAYCTARERFFGLWPQNDNQTFLLLCFLASLRLCVRLSALLHLPLIAGAAIAG